MTNHEKEIYNKMTQQNGYKMVGYDYYSEYCKDIHSVDKDLNIPYVEYSTLKCHEYDGEVIDGKGIIYYFPHYVIRSKRKFNIEPGCGFIDITEFTSYHYGDDATVVIKESEMKDVCVKGFRLFICDLINNNIHFLNASKIGYEEDYRKYAAYNLLVNLVEFNNNHKSMIWQHPRVVGQSSCVIALNHNGYWCFNTINFFNSYDVMLYDTKRQIDNNAHNKKDIVKNGNVITVPLDKSKPIIDDENIKEDQIKNLTEIIADNIKDVASKAAFNFNDGKAELVQPGTAKITNRYGSMSVDGIKGRYGSKSVVDILGCDMTGVKPSVIDPILSTTTIENRVGDDIVAVITKHEAEVCARKLSERQNHDANTPKPKKALSKDIKANIMERLDDKFAGTVMMLINHNNTILRKLFLNEDVSRYRVAIIKNLFINVLCNPDPELKNYDLSNDPCITNWYLYLSALIDVYNISILCNNINSTDTLYHLLRNYIAFLYDHFDLIKHHPCAVAVHGFIVNHYNKIHDDLPYMTSMNFDAISNVVYNSIMNCECYEELKDNWKIFMRGLVEQFNQSVNTVRNNTVGIPIEYDVFMKVWKSYEGKALMHYIDFLGWHDDNHDIEFKIEVKEDTNGRRYLQLLDTVPYEFRGDFDDDVTEKKKKNMHYDPKAFVIDKDSYLTKPGDAAALY